MIECAESHSVAPQVLEDFRAAQEYCRRTGYRGRLTVRRDAVTDRAIVKPQLSPTQRLAEIQREIAADRQHRLATAERDLPGFVRRGLRLKQIERELGT